MAVQLWRTNPGWLVSVAQCVLLQDVQISVDASLALDEVAIVCAVAAAVQSQRCVRETASLICRFLHSKFCLQGVNRADNVLTVTAQICIWVTGL